jgi:site-specific recombinase XerD
VSALAPTLEAFFTERLINQKRASAHTITAYRDTFRLLLGFVQRRTGKAPSELGFEDVDATLIGAFLEHLEHERHNRVRTRNSRLAAIHSMFRFAALLHPEHAAVIGRVLAIPTKRADRTDVSFLDHEEIDALLAAPDHTRWIGRRDHALLATAVQTGLRVSELTGLCCADVNLGKGRHVRCSGKGRKERCTPLTAQTASILRVWLQEGGHEPACRVLVGDKSVAIRRPTDGPEKEKYGRTLAEVSVGPVSVTKHSCATAPPSGTSSSQTRTPTSPGGCALPKTRRGRKVGACGQPARPTSRRLPPGHRLLRPLA